MTNEDVLAAMRKTLRSNGKMNKALGIFLLVLPAIILVLTLPNLISGRQTIGDFIGPNLVFGVLFTLPGVLLIRSGVRKSKPERNTIYNAYLHSPNDIVWVYEYAHTFNDVPFYKVMLHDNKGKDFTIESSLSQYRLLFNCIADRCTNAVAGYRDEWKTIYFHHAANFKAEVLRFEQTRNK